MADQKWHASTRDDYFASILAQPSPAGLGDRVRFDHSTGIWHIWNKVIWEPDRTTYVFDLIRDCMIGWFSDSTVTAEDVKRLSALLDVGKKMAVLKSLASMPGIAMSGDEWDSDPELMGFTNGILNLRTLTLDTHPDPALLIARSTGVDWDPNADVAPFLKFVDDIMSNDADMTEYLLRVLGYSMLGTNKEQKFWMWVGQGQNGKGVLARTVAKALGDYAATPPDTLYMKTKYGAASSDKPRPELLKLEGARFTYMSEPQGGAFNEEMLKAHTGNDFIEARTLHSKTFKTFQPTHKVIFLTNNPPRTDDVGPSMQRRARIVWFEQDYRDPKRDDKELEERLKTTALMQGALRLMAGAASDYLSMGLPEPAKVTAWSKAYIEENDPLASFVTEMCVTGERGSMEQAGQMWKSFDGWTERTGVEKWSKTGFGLAMSRKFEKKVKTAGTFYVGIRLKNMADAAEEAGDE